jgi:hypothetical protein
VKTQRIVVTTPGFLQPGYLPWLGYFDLLQKADIFVHYDDVQSHNVVNSSFGMSVGC